MKVECDKLKCCALLPGTDPPTSMGSMLPYLYTPDLAHH